jgi:hypothetical protein
MFYKIKDFKTQTTTQQGWLSTSGGGGDAHEQS